MWKLLTIKYYHFPTRGTYFWNEINGLIKKVLTACTREQLTHFNGNICH